MIRWLALLLICSVVASCAPAPRADDDPCCRAPQPGTATIRFNGQMNAGVGYWR